MTKSEMDIKKMRQEERIAKRDRDQRDIENRRKLTTDLYGHTMKAVGSLANGLNDPSWYKKVPGMENITTNISTFYPMNVVDEEMMTLTNGSGSKQVGAPAVYSVRYIPTIGRVHINSYVSPMNYALNRVAAQLEKRNSRVLSYSRDTIGRYFFIGTNIASELTRLNLLVYIYDKYNANFPDLAHSLIAGLGFDWQATEANIPNIRLLLATTIANFNAGVAVPTAMSVTARSLWLAKTIIRDGVLVNSPYIVFSPIVEFGLNRGNAPVDVYVSRIRSIDPYLFLQGLQHDINELQNGATWRPLIRDIRGGFEQSEFIQVEGIDQFKPNVVVSDEVRSQFMNLETVPVPTLAEGRGAYQTGLVHDSTSLITIDPGFVFESCSVGGDADENVVQGLDVAYPGLETGLPCATIIDVAPSTHTQTNYHWESNEFKKLLNAKLLMNVFKDNVTEDDTLVNTRFKTSWRTAEIGIEVKPVFPAMFAHSGSGTFKLMPDTNTYTVPLSYLYPLYYGTELIMGIYAVDQEFIKLYASLTNLRNKTYVINIGSLYEISLWQNNSGMLYDADLNSERLPLFSTGVCNIENFNINTAGYFSKLDFLPVVKYSSSYDVGDPDSYNFVRVGDIGKIVEMPVDLLSRIHYQCIESEYTIANDVFLKPLK